MEGWPRPHLLTVHDYYRMAEAGVLSPEVRTELVEGEIIDMPPIGDRHAAVVQRLNERLVHAVGESAEVSLHVPVRLSERSEPHPDVAVVKQNVFRNAHPEPAEVQLLIEVSDATLRYDLGPRAQLYARHAIPEYWVVDLQTHRVWRHRAPGGQQYAKREKFTTGALPLPGFSTSVEIGDLFLA
jgi:Uma2 family endonuclease